MMQTHSLEDDEPMICPGSSARVFRNDYGEKRLSCPFEGQSCMCIGFLARWFRSTPVILLHKFG